MYKFASALFATTLSISVPSGSVLAKDQFGDALDDILSKSSFSVQSDWKFSKEKKSEKKDRDAIEKAIKSSEKKEKKTLPQIVAFVSGQVAQRLDMLPPSSSDVRSISMSSINRTPLGMKGVPHSVEHLFGWNQHQMIIDRYNPHLRWADIEDIDVLKYPLVYDPLRKTFPDTIENLLEKYGNLTWYVAGERTVVIVLKAKDWKRALWYYKEGQLTVATYVSTGRKSSPRRNEEWEIIEPGGIETPNGVYIIDEKDPYHRSSKHRSAPMPNALHMKPGNIEYSGKAPQGIYIHGRKANGNKLSHGCVGIPYAFSEGLYQLIETWTPVVVYLK